MKTRPSRVAVVTVAVLGLLASACSGGSSDLVANPTTPPVPTEAPAPTAAPEPTAVPTAQPAEGPTATPSPTPEPTVSPFDDIVELQHYLPDGSVPWELVAVRVFDGPDQTAPEQVSRLVVYRESAGLADPAVQVTLERYASPDDVRYGSLLSADAGQETNVEGLTDARSIQPADFEFSAVSGLVDSVTVISGQSSTDLAAVISVVEAVAASISDPAAQLRDDVAIDGWVAVVGRTGADQTLYELDFRGPTGTISVLTAPSATLDDLRVSADSSSTLLPAGQVGQGHTSLQELTEGVEIVRVNWWVPNAVLSVLGGSVAPEEIAQFLDTFVPADAETFLTATADAVVEVIPIETQSEAPVPGEEGSAPGTLPPEDIAPLAAFVEEMLGRSFDGTPSVTLLEQSALVDQVPAGFFVSEELWQFLLALGLVTADDDRIEAGAVRSEDVRGVCCPLQVRDTGDPVFNQIVLVHELTHALDAELQSGSGSLEVVSPAQALLEGNAHRVAFAYADQLASEGFDVPEPPEVFSNPDDPRLPSAVRQILEFPYDEGRLFALEVAANGGEDGIVAAFADPPRTSEQILNHEAFLSGEGAAEVEPPQEPEGTSVMKRGRLGAFVLRLLLEPSISEAEAQTLALTWAGDSYVMFADDDQTCIAANVVLDSAAAATDIAELLGDATVAGESLSFTRCSS